MTSSDVLKDTWSALEAEREQIPGIYERRVFGQSTFTAYAGLVRPELRLRFSVLVPSSTPTDNLERETRGFRVHRQYVAVDKATRISLELGDVAFRELFVVMAADVAVSVLACSDDATAIDAMRSRLNHWERFMRSAGLGGLSREGQIGLVGELLFLRTMFRDDVPAAEALASWTGPSGANQDFQCGGRALEVKTTVSNTSTAITVSNELQLDDTDCEALCLLHVRLKEQESGGFTLPQLVDEVAATLSEGVASEFADRLVQAGYHSMHTRLYEGTQYVERTRKYYAVKGSFPRIRQGELRSGVQQVSYLADLSGCEGLQVSELATIATLLRGES